MVAPFSGTVFLVTLGKHSPWGSLNAHPKEMYKAGILGKQHFYLITFYDKLLVVLTDEFLTVFK